MNRDRLWMIGAVLVMVVVLLAGWTVGVSPLLTQAAGADSQTASINASNRASQTKLAALSKQFLTLPALQAELQGLRASIPTGADIAVFLKEINALCDSHKVTLASVAVNDAQVYVNPSVPATPPASTGTASTPTPTPTPTPTTTAGATPAAPAVSGLAPGAFVLIPIVISVSGSFDDVKAFFGGLQSGARLYFASQVSASQATTGKGSVVGTITGFAFTLTGTSPELTPAPVATPAPAATPTPGATVTPTTTPTSPTPTPAP